MRAVEQDDRKDEYEEPAIGGTTIRNLRYADDRALLSTTPTGLEKLIKSINQSNFYSANIPCVARLSGATARSVFKCEVVQVVS